MIFFVKTSTMWLWLWVWWLCTYIYLSKKDSMRWQLVVDVVNELGQKETSLSKNRNKTAATAAINTTTNSWRQMAWHVEVHTTRTGWPYTFRMAAFKITVQMIWITNVLCCVHTKKLLYNNKIRFFFFFY